MSISGDSHKNSLVPLRRQVGASPKTKSVPIVQTDLGDRFERLSLENPVDDQKISSLSLPDAQQWIRKTFPKAEKNFMFSVMRAGELGHVLWGRKPMAWMGNADQTDQGWPALKALANAGVPLRDNFILLDADEMAPGSGFLINKRNLGAVLNEHPEILDPWPALKKMRTDDLIRRFETLNPVSKALLSGDQSLGALLGYGPNNASKWCRLNDRPVSGPPLKGLPDTSIPVEEMRKSKETLTQERSESRMHATGLEIVEQDASPYKVYLPGFVAFDASPETEELVTRYLEDSWLIRDHLEAQRSRDIDQLSGNPQRTYSEFLTNLLLKNIFQFGSEPLHPGFYRRSL